MKILQLTQIILFFNNQELFTKTQKKLKFPQNTLVTDKKMEQVLTMTMNKIIISLKPKTIKLLMLFNIQLSIMKEILIFRRTLIMDG